MPSDVGEPSNSAAASGKSSDEDDEEGDDVEDGDDSEFEKEEWEDGEKEGGVTTPRRAIAERIVSMLSCRETSCASASQ